MTKNWTLPTGVHGEALCHLSREGQRACWERLVDWAETQNNVSIRNLAKNWKISKHPGILNALADSIPADGWLVLYKSAANLSEKGE